MNVLELLRGAPHLAPRFFPLLIVMFQSYFVSMPVSTFRPIFVPFQLISLGYAFKFRQQLSHMTELV